MKTVFSVPYLEIGSKRNVFALLKQAGDRGSERECFALIKRFYLPKA